MLATPVPIEHDSVQQSEAKETSLHKSPRLLKLDDIVLVVALDTRIVKVICRDWSLLLVTVQKGKIMTFVARERCFVTRVAGKRRR
jgi:hypothetical protein